MSDMKQSSKSGNKRNHKQHLEQQNNTNFGYIMFPYSSGHCSFACSYKDEKLEAVEGISASKMPHSTMESAIVQQVIKTVR